MPRTLPAALAAKIASGTARLSTILEIRRRDGAFIRLTDASADITADARLYHSEGGYERSALAVRDGFEIDDLEITGHFHASWGVTREDITARLYAAAPITMWWLDRSDPTDARGVFLTGKIGRLRPRADNTWSAELRGLKAQLTRIVVAAYGFECTAQLGDLRCRIPLAPLEVQREAAYVVGDFVRVATHASAPARAAVPILNSSFEAATAGKPDDWTEIRGAVEVVAADGELGPAEGSSFIEGEDAAAEFAIEQTVAITGLGVGNASIDAGEARCSVHARRGVGRGERDLGRFLVEALDGAGANLGAVYDSGFERIAFEDRWDLRGATGVVVPANTRSLRFTLDGRRRSGTRCQAAFDDVHALIWDAGASPLGQEEWENRIYECTTAGTAAASAPTYDEAIDSTTGDGSAVFTARESWMKHATVTAVTDARNFTVDVVDSRAVSGWFAHGVCHWETGANAGLGMEIKTSSVGGDLELFLAMRRTIAVGDRVRLFPGCARAFSICKGKFDNALNYRGHPHIPGTDYIATYPDAR